uniref:Putative sphingolipid transporter spinster homolog 2 isoform X3 n=1 Tax=Rhizophora mucronata TaxID=61149 RepID=A0A2P2M9U2_RHIMU
MVSTEAAGLAQKVVHALLVAEYSKSCLVPFIWMLAAFLFLFLLLGESFFFSSVKTNFTLLP